MTDDIDQRIADLLRADLGRDTAPASDPLFRVQVLARLQRKQYRRRVVGLVACACVLAIVAAVGAGLGGVAREAMGAVLVGSALLAFYFIAGPAFAQLLGRPRR